MNLKGPGKCTVLKGDPLIGTEIALPPGLMRGAHLLLVRQRDGMEKIAE